MHTLLAQGECHVFGGVGTEHVVTHTDGEDTPGGKEDAGVGSAVTRGPQRWGGGPPAEARESELGSCGRGGDAPEKQARTAGRGLPWTPRRSSTAREGSCFLFPPAGAACSPGNSPARSGTPSGPSERQGRGAADAGGEVPHGGAGPHSPCPPPPGRVRLRPSPRRSTFLFMPKGPGQHRRPVPAGRNLPHGWGSGSGRWVMAC